MLQSLMATALARIEPVRIARTEAERTAIYRMRYDIYVGEKNEQDVPFADHALRQIRTPEDDLPESMHIYCGTPTRMKGALRVRAFASGRIPRDFFERYCLDRFPDIDSRAVCNVAFLMVTPSLRSTLTTVTLTSGAVENTVRAHRSELLIVDAAPGLIRAYERFGLRPYGGRVLSMSRGMQIPLAGVVGDLEHSRRCKSPWYPALRKLSAEGSLPTRDFSALCVPFAKSGVEIDPERMERAALTTLARHGSMFLERLPKKVLRRLVEHAVLVDVEAGTTVIAEGFACRDILLIIDGELEIRLSNGRTKKARAGEVLGGVSLLSRMGRRSATAITTKPSRLLVLRYGQIRRITRAHPSDGVAIYEALAHILAERFLTDEAKPR